MPNLIEMMGANYFNEKFANAYLVIDGRVLQVGMCNRADRVHCMDVEAGEAKIIPSNKFTGFKAFEYPLLGYRKFGEHMYGYAYKRQTANRGFRSEQVNITWTGCTRALADLGLIKQGRITDSAKVVALLKPQFDSIKDLPKLLNGEVSGLVLNNNVMIEPSTTKAGGWYSILYKQAEVGEINSKGVVSYNEPGFASVIGL